MNCPVCNTTVQPGQHYCPVCRSDLYAGSGTQPVAQQAYQPVRRVSRPIAQNTGTLVQCPSCGRPIPPGEVCACQRSIPSSGFAQRPAAPVSGQMPPVTGNGTPMSFSASQPLVTAPQTKPQAKAPARLTREIPGAGEGKNFLKQFLSRSGLITEKPGNTFEEGMMIVPDAVKPLLNEQPVRQFDVATLRSRFMGITTNRARARVMVTTDRVILRAAGTGLQGRSTLQQQVNLDDVGSLQLSRVMTAHPGDLIPILLVSALLCMLISMMGGIFAANLRWIPAVVIGLLSIAFGLLVKGWWMPKSFLCLGAGAAVVMSSIRTGLPSMGLLLPALIFLGFGILFTLYAIVRPQLTLKVLVHEGQQVILLKRGGSVKHGSCGFGEVLSDESIFTVIAELNAVIINAQRGNRG